jgi:lipopolysaccharide/colanic/teichoic acid biosynthesis glycosyltransferase
MMKRLFDFSFAMLSIIFVLPLLIILSISIKFSSKGPVFYKGKRVGQFGKHFLVYKFRTMVIDAEDLGGPSTSDDDPRITKIGKSLRKFKLDEIPQLINILKGEMSFVGPRPEIPDEVETYSEDEKRILLVKPGITDWASIKFHNEGEILKGSQDPHKAYREKIRPGKLKLALYYVDNRSFWIDMKIILKTLTTLIKTRTAGG